jgi:stress-induced-phosphoprotein 1
MSVLINYVLTTIFFKIMSIMNDPIMQSILQQAQSDPAALQEHMRNPGVASNIRKLIAAGVIRVGR